MIKFPVNFIIVSSHSEIRLNDEWTLLWDYFLDKGLKLNVTLESRREITSEGIPISGQLSVSNSNYPGVSSEFFKYMKSSQSVQLVQLLINQNATSTSYVKEFRYLIGDIFITSTSNKCSCGLQSAKSDKCVQMTSLVQLSNDFERLLDPETSCFADVKLMCSDVSIPAHKVILSARSPVFKAMFESPMKESRENEVNITDIDVSVLRTMMTYIYTGQVPELTLTLATDLLVAADKYIIQDLKEVCCDFLKKNATFQHVLTALIRGDIPCLKTFVMDYISSNSTDFSLIENTEEWKSLKNVNPALAIEILEYFVKLSPKN